MRSQAERPSLSRSALVGFGATIFSRAARSLVGIGTISVLSRYISPTEFGLFSLIFFVILFSQVFADFGLRVSLVQRPEITELEKNSVFWAGIALGLAVTLAVFFGADFLAGLFQEPGLAKYLRYISPLFVVITAQGVSTSILEREFRFGQIATAELVPAILGALAAVAMAIGGFKVMALVAQQIVITVAGAAMLIYYAKWLPRLSFSFAALRPLIRYGAYVTAAGAVFTVGDNAARPIVSTRISPADLGFFTISQQIVLAPLRTISTNIRRVSFPIMATIQHDHERVWRAYLSTAHGLMLVMAPISLGIWALAVPITDILLGKGWEPVAPLLGYLTVAALFQTLADLNSGIFASKGRAAFLFRWTLCSAVLNIAVLWFLAPYGIVTLVMGKMLLTMILFPVLTLLLARMLGQKLWPVIETIWKQVAAAAAMAVAVRLLDGWLAQAGLFSIGRIAVGGAVGALLYAGLVLLIDRRRSLELLARVRGV